MGVTVSGVFLLLFWGCWWGNCCLVVSGCFYLVIFVYFCVCCDWRLGLLVIA